MNVIKTTKKILTLITIIMIGIFFSLAVTDCRAGSNKEIVYSGQVKAKDGALTSVNLTIKYPLIPGKKEAATLRYGGKRMCTCQGTYEGRTENKEEFSLLSQNGGSFCDKLDNLEIRQSKTADNEVSYTASSSDGSTVEEGSLRESSK